MEALEAERALSHALPGVGGKLIAGAFPLRHNKDKDKDKDKNNVKDKDKDKDKGKGEGKED